MSFSPVLSFLYIVLTPSRPSEGTVSSLGHAEISRFTRPIVSAVAGFVYILDSVRRDVLAWFQNSISERAFQWQLKISYFCGQPTFRSGRARCYASLSIHAMRPVCSLSLVDSASSENEVRLITWRERVQRYVNVQVARLGIQTPQTLVFLGRPNTIDQMTHNVRYLVRTLMVTS